MNAITNILVTIATNAALYTLGPADGSMMTQAPWITDAEETVALVTNIVETSNESGCQTCSAAGPGFISSVYVYGGFHQCEPYKPATERTETTTVTEIKTLRFRWDDEACEVKREREVSRRVRVWRKKDEWVEVER